MKKICLILTCFILILTLCACKSEDTAAFEKSDEYAKPFLESLVAKNNEDMAKYIHPDYMAEAMPNDKFYSDMAEKHFFKPNKTLTAVTATGKSYINNTDIEGTLLECAYVIFYNELYYDVKITVLDNEKGYGVISFSMELNLDTNLYLPEDGE